MAGAQHHVELVVNRWRKAEFDDESLGKALGLPPKWKVPNDYAAARGAADTGTPFMAGKNAMAPVLQLMARTASGRPPLKEKKKGLFG